MMSRRNPIRLEPGREYQLDGKKRRWKLYSYSAAGGAILKSPNQPDLELPLTVAQRRLREVQD